MDASVSRRLDASRNNPFYDPELAKKLASTTKDYVLSGVAALNYATPDFDAASDIFEMFAPVDDPVNFAKLDRTAAINFRHPLGFTELTTLTTFVAELLFGAPQSRSVDAQGPDDDPKAEAVNQLLAWNDAKISVYKAGRDWVQNAIVYNRAIWYESSGQNVTVEKELIEEDDTTAEQIPLTNKDGSAKMRGGKQVTGYPKKSRYRNKRTYSGFFNKVDLVSPYDFICDPALPVDRFQEGRFAAHRVMIPWHELKRRSELEPTDDQYVLPEAVAKLKTQKGNHTVPAAIGAAQGVNTSRAYYERQQRGTATAGIGGTGMGLIAGGDSVNKDDGGIVECWNLIIRARPKALGLFEDEETELIQILSTANSDVLSVNIRNHTHDEFPYCIGEARPDAHKQFGPGWALAIKPVQDRVDNLNLNHSKAQARMGNIIGVDLAKCDIANILAPEKNGLFVFKTELGSGANWDEILKQISLTDTTAKYPEEMAMWKQQAEDTTGAHAFTQGRTEDPSQTLGQFNTVAQMATGRISSLARILSEGALVKQTRRFVSNFQQFMPDEQIVRVTGEPNDFDPDNPPQKFVTVRKADIQAEFDIVPHDGSLPGADAKVVAAGSRAVEAMDNPAFAEVFDNTQPGAIDVKKLAFDIFKKSGLNVTKYAVTRKEAQQNALAKGLAQGNGIPQPGQPTMPMPPTNGNGAPAPRMDVAPGLGTMPSASELPPIPSAAPAMAHPGNI